METSAPVVPAPTPTPPPAAVGGAAGEEKTSVNPYVDVINRRLRTLKKRLAKIAANEDARRNGKQLDSDQLASIARKGEVEVLIKELEEIEAAQEAIDAEQQRNEKKLQKKRRNDELKAAQAAKEREQQRQRDQESRDP